jgi:RNA polymerase sigma-70 factor (ECF subfamily)
MKSITETGAQGTPRGRRSEDVEAWRELVRRFAPYVHAIVRANRLPEPEAEHVFEEVFARTWARIDELDDDEAIRSWIVELAGRVASDRRVALQPGVAAPSAEHVQELRRALMVREAIRRLPAAQREVLDRRFVDGQDDATIAAALGLTEPAVAAQLARALARLRAHLHGRAAPRGL